MKTTYQLGHVLGLKLTAGPSAFIAAVALVVGLFMVGITLLSLSTVAALLFAMLFTILHYGLVVLVHQYGHALAAEQVGYPMKGVRYYLALGRSIYPSDEPPLKPRQHIQRALGGPALSALASIFFGILSLLTRDSGGLIFYLFAGLFIDFFLIFTIGAFLPLGFTDGSTIIRNLRKM